VKEIFPQRISLFGKIHKIPSGLAIRLDQLGQGILTKVKNFQRNGNPPTNVKKLIPPSGHSVRGPLFRCIFSGMTIRKIFCSWDRIVKDPQINDAVLSHNDAMYMRSKPSSSPATVAIQVISSREVAAKEICP
jgi:hypothetical protein